MSTRTDTATFQSFAAEQAPLPLLLVRVHFSIGGYEKTETCEVPGLRNFPELLGRLNTDRFISLVMEGDDVPSYVNCAHIVVVEQANTRI